MEYKMTCDSGVVLAKHSDVIPRYQLSIKSRTDSGSIDTYKRSNSFVPTRVPASTSVLGFTKMKSFTEGQVLADGMAGFGPAVN